MPRLITESHLFIAQPPLYKIKIGSTEHWVYNDAEKEAILAQTKSTKVDIQRYKGLGEMSAEQLWRTTMDPASRTLLEVKVEDAAKADQIFNLLMGGEVAPRKAFIQSHSRTVKNLDI